MINLNNITLTLDDVKYNGASLNKLQYNGVTVWEKEVEDDENLLCFTAQQKNSTILLRKNGSPAEGQLEYSNNSSNWQNYIIGQKITLANVGDKVYFRNTSTTTTRFSTDTYDNYKFEMTGKIAASGDVTYLLNKNGTNTLSDYCFERLFFNCASLTTAPELPAINLAECCYSSMFAGCWSLTTPPELPATRMRYACYISMFQDCPHLTTAPELPAISLAGECYHAMFAGCTRLTTAPELPALNLEKYCYYAMFADCTSLTTIPELPAMQCASGCYLEMFRGCTSLQGDIVLPARVLANGCYEFMFKNCPLINCITIYGDERPDCTGMVYGCSETGTLYLNNTWTDTYLFTFFTNTVPLDPPEGWTIIRTNLE